MPYICKQKLAAMLKQAMLDKCKFTKGKTPGFDKPEKEPEYEGHPGFDSWTMWSQYDL